MIERAAASSYHEAALDPDALTFLLRTIDLPGLLAREGVPRPDACASSTAALLGVDPPALQALEQRIDAARARAAAAVVDRLGGAAAVAALPFSRADVVVAVGDSITADRCSWIEVIGHVLAEHLPASRRPRLVNAGVSGDRSADVLRRIDDVLAFEPTRVWVLLGSNDAQRLRSAREVRLVSGEETARNLCAIDRLLARSARARVLWLAPPLPVPAHIDASTMLGSCGLTFEPADVRAIGASVRALGRHFVDLAAVLGDPPRAELLEDGLHPTPDGHAAIAAAVLCAVAAAA